MRFLGLLIAATALTACSFDHLKDSGVKHGGGAIITRPVSYAEVFGAVLQPRCVGCHGAGGGNQGNINLESYESTFPLASQIQKAALSDKTMPKGGSLDDNESALLDAWIAQGATRNGGEAPNPKLRENVNWATIRDEILDKKCLDCHSPPKAEKDLDLSSLTVVKAKIGIIFDHAVVTGDMPMPPFEHLTPEEKQALAQWIALGMPE